MRKVLVIILGIVLAIGLFSSACTPQAPKQSAADFYVTNPLNIIVTHSAGGGVDLGARLFANFWTSVGGKAAMVENKPGGAGVVALNYVKGLTPDGLTMLVGHFSASLVGPIIFHADGVQYDFSSFSYIGMIPGDIPLLALRKDVPIKSVEQLRAAQGLKFFAVAPGDRMAGACALAIADLGLKGAKIITGYSGTSEFKLALGRGEVDAGVQDSPIIAQLLAEPQPVIQPPLLTVDEERSSLFPNISTIPELVKLSSEQKIDLQVLSRALKAGVVFAFPKGVPADKLEFLRDAFQNISEMQGFKDQAKVRWPAMAKPLYGAEVAKLIDSITKFKDEDLTRYDQQAKKY